MDENSEIGILLKYLSVLVSVLISLFHIGYFYYWFEITVTLANILALIL